MFFESGKVLTQKEILEIASNYSITRHCKQRIEERNKELDLFYAIIDCDVAYFNTDKSINIALDKYNYIVAKYDDIKNTFMLITYKEPSYNGVTVYDKLKLIRKGVERINR